MQIPGEKKIKILPDGPYQVTGNIPLDQLRFVPDRHGNSKEYEKIRDCEMQETYHLCRCGMSGCKPVCDGSHLNGFDGKETASFQTYHEIAKRIEGKVIDILDAEELCAVARFCDTHGTTWNLVENNTAPDTADIVTYQCNHCPSGRLTAVTKEGKEIEPELPQEISVLEDNAYKVHGPLWVKGGITIESQDGRIYPVRNRVTLCRCGKSENKPFCDAAHTENKGEIGFE